jgi:hypothetical protein
MNPARRLLLAAPLLLAAAFVSPVRATGSEASVLSLLPMIQSSEAPTTLFAASAALTVVAMQSTDEGAVWTLERVSDGARGSMKMARGSLGPVGGKLLVVALSTGWVLYNSAGKAVAWTPNELGASLLHNERLSE